MADEIIGQTPKERFDDETDCYKAGSTSNPLNPVKGNFLSFLENPDETDKNKSVVTTTQIDLISDVIKELCGLTLSEILPYSGSGTELDPYLIDTPHKLDMVRNNLSAFYKQTANISLSKYFSWNPIGDLAHPFRGNYDGNGYAISDLTCNEVSYSGLFGCLNGASLTDIVITEAVISTSAINEGEESDCGVLAAVIAGTTGSTITGCRAEGTLSAILRGGGLIGNIQDGNTIISLSSADVSVTIQSGSGLGGGFVATTIATISESKSTGNVSGGSGSTIGGFAGNALSGAIANCYTTGNVTGTGDASGGFLGTSEAGLITNCYATGAVSNNATAHFGFCALAEYNDFTGSFFDVTTTGQTETPNAGAIGYITATMKTPAIYSDAEWDADVWLLENNQYPVLKWEA